MNKEHQVSSERFEKPSPAVMAIRGMLNNVKSPFKMGRALLQNAPGVVKQVQKSLSNAEEDAKRSVPVTRFNLETSAHRVFDAAEVSLADFKPIRALSPGSTVNDVVLAVCAGALRQYLVHHKELPQESLRAFAPVNTRSGAADESDPGNNISTMSPLLYTDVEDDVERLRCIHQETTEQKAARKGISARLMTDVTKHAAATTQLLAARMLINSEMASRMTNVCISNVPGPQVPVFMTGAKLISQMGLGPLSDRMGLFLAVTSYAGRMTFSATSCRRTMPDIEFFIQCLRDNFDSLLKASKKTSSTKRKASKKKQTTKPQSSKQSASKEA